MDIVRNWITLKLGLQVPQPEDFEKGIANGVLIAEILRKYGVLSDDEEISLKHGSQEKTRLENMMHLEKWLNESGVKIKNSDLEAIAREKKGVGLRLLYELFLCFEFGPRDAKFAEESQPGIGTAKVITSRIPERRDDDLGICSDKRPTTDCLTDPQGTSFDRMEFPKHAVLQKPYIQSSEAAQAQHLYFCLRSLDVLKKQEEKRLQFAIDRQDRLKEFQMSRGQDPEFQDQEQISGEYKLDSASIQTRQLQKVANAKAAKLKSLVDDMDKFDLISAQAELRCDSTIPVYAGGRGDICEYELKIYQLRIKRFRNHQREEERAIMRREILSQFTKNVPLEMTKSLEQDIMSRLTKLPASERLLAAFLYRCHQEKQHFFDHAAYEARQLQAAMTFDLEKEMRIKGQDEEFKSYAYAEQANPYKTFDFVCRALEEPDLIQRLAGADDTIRDMIQRALKLNAPPPPPPPPCTPTFMTGKRCRMVMDKTYGRMLVCEDELFGEDGTAPLSYCRVLPPEWTGEQE